MIELRYVVAAMLIAARQYYLGHSSDHGRMVEETGDVNGKGDRTLLMDKGLEEALIACTRQFLPDANIFSEEIGTLQSLRSPVRYTVTFDPLDGTNNFRCGKGLQRFGTFVAIYEGEHPTLKDVVAAGMVEYTSGQKFFFCRGDGATLQSMSLFEVSKKTIITLDLHHESGYRAYAPFVQDLFMHNTGSQAGNLLLYLNGVSAMLGGVAVGAEEVGTIYALVKAAGGIVVDHDGNDIGDLPFDPERKYQLFAGVENIVRHAIERMKQEPR